MALAQQLQTARKQAGFTLDQLAHEAKVSKTYLWELENDDDGEKKPSAEVLLKIAAALKTTIADLLSLPTVQVSERPVELSPSLIEFRDRKEEIGEPLTENDIRDLATMRFRGGQPKTRDDWDDLYRTLKRTTRK